jgi:probable phosphoglycerate mutase
MRRYDQQGDSLLLAASLLQDLKMGREAPKQPRDAPSSPATPSPADRASPSGRTPGIDLSDTGREQATRLGDRLAGLPVAAVYASPIERTTQTAEAVARHGLPSAAGALEADYGEWTGRHDQRAGQDDL